MCIIYYLIFTVICVKNCEQQWANPDFINTRKTVMKLSMGAVLLLLLLFKILKDTNLTMTNHMLLCPLLYKKERQQSDHIFCLFQISYFYGLPHCFCQVFTHTHTMCSKNQYVSSLGVLYVTFGVFALLLKTSLLQRCIVAKFSVS